MSNLTAYTDGACRLSNPGLCAAGFIIYDGGIEIHRRCRVLDGMNTNNVSEYTGMIDLLEWANILKLRGMTIHCDSMLVVNQSQGRWAVKPELEKYAARCFDLLTRGGHTLLHVKGHDGDAGNEAVDRLCNETLDQHQGIVTKPKKKRKSNAKATEIEA